MSTIPEIPGAKTAEVNRFLHVNLNCASLERSRDLYTSVFGLREVMYNESVDSDGSLMDRRTELFVSERRNNLAQERTLTQGRPCKHRRQTTARRLDCRAANSKL